MQTAQLTTSTKVIPDFPNYRISRDGEVWSSYKFKTNKVIDTWRLVKPIVDKATGYWLVTLCHQEVRRNRFIHRLLAQAYLPNPLNKPHVNHIDANKLNYSLSNLEWATPKENASHAASLGLYQPSIDKTSRAVQQIDLSTGALIKEHSSLHEAGRASGTQWQNIWKVCDGRRKTAGGYRWSYL